MIGSQNNQQHTFQEYLLLDYVQRMEARKYDHRAVHLHLSRLKPFHCRDYHIRVATNTFESYVKLYVGRIFVLSNNDLIFIWKDKSIADVEPAVDTLKYLFRDDPLSHNESEETGFCTWYNLANEYQEMAVLAEDLNERAKKKQIELRQTQNSVPDTMPIDANNLAQLEETIATADLGGHVKQQPVCVIRPNMDEPVPVFDEFFVSIAELRDALLPNINLASNRWLFQHLTEVLDKRMLNYLGQRTFRTHASSFSINMNLCTLKETDFQLFDERVARGWQGNIVIELNQVDLFANLELYIGMCDDLHDKGYRLLVDNLTAESLSFVDRARLKADFIKLAWRPEMTDTVIRSKYKELDTVVQKVGRERVIMCRCDSPTAIRFGWELGVTLFQGRFVDQRLAQIRRKKRQAQVKKAQAKAKAAG